MYQFGYEDSKNLMGVWIQCTNSNKRLHCEILDTVTKDIIMVFIKDVGFHRIGISWLNQTKEKISFDVDKTCAPWCKYFSW